MLNACLKENETEIFKLNKIDKSNKVMWVNIITLVFVIIATSETATSRYPENDTLIFIANPVEADMPGHWMPLSVVKVILGGTVKPKKKLYKYKSTTKTTTTEATTITDPPPPPPTTPAPTTEAATSPLTLELTTPVPTTQELTTPAPTTSMDNDVESLTLCHDSLFR
ncbi:unnamed protein product [Leptidea sinapis]|uniref:Uncharacterized protein n=1 Tax=Leptidea sinapis TaxID=189913 RepID=A0A5E4R5M7_9NEOP|nr:unnamed protein product [Leptidea sinapis]